MSDIFLSYSFLSPFFIYVIYSSLSALHHASIFQIAYNYDVKKVEEYSEQKHYLKNILTVIFQKSTLLDAYGLHFLLGVHERSGGEKRSMSVMIKTIVILFFMIFLLSMVTIFFITIPPNSSPFLLYFLSVAKFVSYVMIFRGVLAYIVNTVEWFRYKWFVRNTAIIENKDNPEFSSWTHWFSDKIDHMKGLVDFVQKESSDRAHLITFNTKTVDLITYISSDRSGTQKIIYFCVFAASVVNSFMLVESFMQKVGDDDIESSGGDSIDSGENFESNKDEKIRAKRVLPKVLFRLLLLTVFSYFVMCVFVTLIWILGRVSFNLSLKLHETLANSITEESSLFFKQLTQLILLVTTKEYDTSSIDMTDWKTQFKEILVKQVFVTGIFVFLYGYLFTSIFAVWFESKPGRYSRSEQIRGDELEEGFRMESSEVMDRIRRYTHLCKAFIVCTGFFVGCMKIYSCCVANKFNSNAPESFGLINLLFGAFGLLVVNGFMFLLFYV